MSGSCRRCGRPIVWGKLHDGRRVPLDPEVPVYDLEKTRPNEDGTWTIARTKRAMANHLSRCEPRAEGETELQRAMNDAERRKEGRNG